ncbi:NAD(P)-dependent oxidoreductase [Leptothrix discophora]|uniref:NAD(P)-binding domain-containing protein n=1 Tax=Leptothrix discophora TaxID=89 RepID=A0ABT9FYY9_LEPDI|nr:NAD(P)-dependent oxidoreductase [Leptothrix discophora]MDP4299351.1 NAD(P)-binding domain-containing protein [Leptothrix discophora]
MKIALVGLGEVGRIYADALRAAGLDLRTCQARASLKAAADAAAAASDADADADADDTLGPWLADRDWILTCVTGSHTLEITRRCLALARPGATLCDLSTASPDTKRESARLAAAASLRYVDVAIMGAVSLAGARTPLLAAGDGAAELARWMSQAGARVQVIEGGRPGDAVALKLLRSAFTKGLEALSVELLVAAERQGLRAQLFEQLRDIDQTPLQDFLEMLVRTHVVHAGRRAHEVHEAAAELARHGPASVVLPGVERRFQQTAAARAESPPPQAAPDMAQALAWLLSRR